MSFFCVLLAVPAAVARAGDGPGEPTDPNRDRVGLTPTAWTQPEGAWSFSSFALFFGRISHSVSHRVQVEVEGFLPNPTFNMGGVAATVVVRDRGDLRLAILGDAGFARDHAQEDGVHPYFRGFVVHHNGQAVGGSLVASLCVGVECRSANTLIARAGFSDVDSESYGELSVAAASTYRVRSVRLFVQGQVESCHVNSDCYDFVGSAGGGIRFPWSRFALDLGWIKGFRDKEPRLKINDLTEFGAPWFSLTYRRL
jgi:hypothetical protein